MAFFALTYLGTQNYLKDVSVNSQKDPLRSGRELGFLALPPLPTKYKETCTAHFSRKMDFSYGRGHQNSFAEMKRLATKHIRCPEGPLELYQRPVTTSHMYGWHHKSQYPITQSEPWTYVKRHPIKENEVTKFVDYMKRIHKEIILF